MHGGRAVARADRLRDFAPGLSHLTHMPSHIDIRRGDWPAAFLACEKAVAADEATFGVSEINWGIPPGSVVSRALAETVRHRDALLYIMTGRTFDGRRAAEIGLVNRSLSSSAAGSSSNRLGRTGESGGNSLT